MALCSVDLNHDVGVFSIVGHSAQGFTAPIGTTVHQIWTIPERRSSKCGQRSREAPFVPSYSLHPSFPRGLLGQPQLSPDRVGFCSRWLLCVGSLPTVSSFSTLQFALAGSVSFSVSGCLLGNKVLQEAVLLPWNIRTR